MHYIVLQSVCIGLRFATYRLPFINFLFVNFANITLGKPIMKRNLRKRIIDL